MWQHAGRQRDACLEWIAPLVEPLATLAAFVVLLDALGTALGADPAPGEGRRLAIAAAAGVGAQLLFTLGHWSGVHQSALAPAAGERAWVFTPFATAAERARALIGIFARFLVFHVPMFATVGLLPYLSPVPMLDFQLIAVVFAIGGHRVVLRAGAAAQPASPVPARRPRDLLPIAVVLGFAAVLRLHDLDYNGEFIDESFYVYAREIGNLFFVSSDSRLWPMIAFPIHAYAGITGVRTVTALIGVLTVLCVYRLALAWSAEMDPDEVATAGGSPGADRHRSVALVAAFLTATASATLLTSVVGRHDALAFLTYAFALSQIALAAHADRPVAMLLGGAALLLSFWIRFALLSYLPLGVMMIAYAQVARRNAYLDALAPVALMALIWAFFDLEHWRIAWDHSRRTPYASAGAIVAESFARVPVVLVSAGLGTALLLLPLRRAPRAGTRTAALRLAAIVIPALGTVGIVAAHTLVARTALSLDRNLTLAVIFGSLLGGSFLVAAARRIPSRIARHAGGAAIAVLATLHAWSIVEREKHAWGDPRPVVAAVAQTLERYRLGPDSVVWSTDDDGGKGNVHALVVGLRGRAVVDNSSPWKQHFWEEARAQRIPVIAGTNRRDPRQPLDPGTEVGGYVVERRVQVPYGPAAHVYVRRDLWRAAQP